MLHSGTSAAQMQNSGVSEYSRDTETQRCFARTSKEESQRLHTVALSIVHFTRVMKESVLMTYKSHKGVQRRLGRTNEEEPQGPHKICFWQV